MGNFGQNYRFQQLFLPEIKSWLGEHRVIDTGGSELDLKGATDFLLIESLDEMTRCAVRIRRPGYRGDPSVIDPRFGREFTITIDGRGGQPSEKDKLLSDDAWMVKRMIYGWGLESPGPKLLAAVELDLNVWRVHHGTIRPHVGRKPPPDCQRFEAWPIAEFPSSLVLRTYGEMGRFIERRQGLFDFALPDARRVSDGR